MKEKHINDLGHSLLKETTLFEKAISILIENVLKTDLSNKKKLKKVAKLCNAYKSNVSDIVLIMKTAEDQPDGFKIEDSDGEGYTFNDVVKQLGLCTQMKVSKNDRNNAVGVIEKASGVTLTKGSGIAGVMKDKGIKVVAASELPSELIEALKAMGGKK